MEAEIRQHFPEAEVRLIKGYNGAFEVSLEGTLIYSKNSLGRHPKEGEVLHILRQS